MARPRRCTWPLKWQVGIVPGFLAASIRAVATGSNRPTVTKNWYSRGMGRNTSFSLDEHYNEFIAAEVASGRYRSASDVVRSALRLLEDHETQLNAVRQALIDGENSGPSTPFDFEAFLARKRGDAER